MTCALIFLLLLTLGNAKPVPSGWGQDVDDYDNVIITPSIDTVSNQDAGAIAGIIIFIVVLILLGCCILCAKWIVIGSICYCCAKCCCDDEKPPRVTTNVHINSVQQQSTPYCPMPAPAGWNPPAHPPPPKY